MVEDALILFAWDAVTSDAALAKLLAALAEAFKCRSAAIVYKDTASSAADISLAYGPCADAAVQRRYALEYAALDPAPEALGRLPIGEVADTDTLFPEEDLHRYRVFLEGFYYPLGLVGALGAPLFKGDSRIGMIAVHRSAERAPFDRSDAERMRRLVPHLVRMIEMRQTFFALGNRSARLVDALEPMITAIIILDGAGTLVEGNAAARTLFARRDGLMLSRNGQVFARDPGAAQALRRSLAARSKEQIISVPRDAGAPYILRVRRRETPPGWVVVASDPEHEGASRPEQLATAFGLSCGAAELLAALVNGETVNEFCTRKTMSRNTAKYHLRTAFAVTGTNRQADLVRRATAILRDIGL